MIRLNPPLLKKSIYLFLKFLPERLGLHLRILTVKVNALEKTDFGSKF